MAMMQTIMEALRRQLMKIIIGVRSVRLITTPLGLAFCFFPFSNTHTYTNTPGNGRGNKHHREGREVNTNLRSFFL